jgi:hypothetical protein
MNEPKQAKGDRPNARGEDVRYPVIISAEEAAVGLVIEIDYDTTEPCPVCKGSGLTIDSKTCPSCGSMLESRRATTFVLRDLCNNCGWKELRRTQKPECESCEGCGLEPIEKSLSIKIPAGIVNKTKLRVAGKGGTGKRGAECGDLFVIVNISYSPGFNRNYRIVQHDDDELFSRNTSNQRSSGLSSNNNFLDEPLARLLEVADPLVFRQNPFRVLGLPVHASEREIKKHVERIQIMARIGDGEIQISGPLSLDPSPDESAVRNAVHELRDPEKRLIYEVLWLWPAIGGDDQALVELSNHRIKAAIEIWEGVESREEVSYIATHNLAVLYHTSAFDLEYTAQFKPLSDDTKKLQDAYWHQALTRWRRLTEDGEFWGLVNSRVRELDEPKLTPGTVRQLQLTLPTALLSLNARLAVTAAERGDKSELKRQRRLMNESGLGTASIEKALSRVLSATRLRITRLCEGTEAEVNGHEEDGAKATRKLLEEAKPLLIMLDELLPAGNSIRDDARDLVAQTALNCQIPFGNKTENWEECVALLELSKPFPVSKSIKDRIAENLKVVQENLRLKTLVSCWFCKGRDFDEDAILEVAMYGDVKRYSTGLNTRRVEWRNVTVRVPRCRECLATHNRTKKFVALGGVLGLVLGLAICLLVWLIAGVNDQTAEPPIVFASGFIIVALAFLGLDIGDQLAKCSTPTGTIHRSHSVVMVGLVPAMGYPGIEEMKSKGWIVGKKPSTS